MNEFTTPLPVVNPSRSVGMNPGPFGGHFGGSEEAHLGIYAKSHSTLDLQGDFPAPSVDQETGEILLPRDSSAVRLGRYALQSVSRNILGRGHRISACLRARQRGREHIDVLHSPSSSSFFYSGLQTCANVWVCPICAAKISERRRHELQTAIARHEAMGGSVALLTLTHAHSRGDSLAGLLGAEQKALKHLFGSRAGRGVLRALGVRGHIRAWEVTHGRLRQVDNGWHPHFHILLFLASHQPLEPFESQLFSVWLRGCELAKLPLPDRRHGLTLHDGTRAAAYVAKWGHEPSKSVWDLDSEMTKGHTKQARDGETPFSLLRSCLENEDAQGVRLFREFSAAFRGKRQLVWSRGLRDLLGVDVLNDEEIATRHEEDAEIFCRLTVDQWRAVRRADLRGELLEVARLGWDRMQEFLESIVCQK